VQISDDTAALVAAHLTQAVATAKGPMSEGDVLKTYVKFLRGITDIRSAQQDD
jgi:hypothetical protein